MKASRKRRILSLALTLAMMVSLITLPMAPAAQAAITNANGAAVMPGQGWAADQYIFDVKSDIEASAVWADVAETIIGFTITLSANSDQWGFNGEIQVNKPVSYPLTYGGSNFQNTDDTAGDYKDIVSTDAGKKLTYISDATPFISKTDTYVQLFMRSDWGDIAVEGIEYIYAPAGGDIVIDWSGLTVGTKFTAASPDALRPTGENIEDAEVLAGEKIKVSRPAAGGNARLGLLLEVDLGARTLGEFSAVTFDITMGAASREIQAYAFETPPTEPWSSSGSTNEANLIGSGVRTATGADHPPADAEANMTISVKDSANSAVKAYTGVVYLAVIAVRGGSVNAITLSNIVLHEAPARTDDGDVDEAIGLIEAAFADASVDQADVNTEADAKAYVEVKLDNIAALTDLNLDGVEVTTVDFEPAEAGTADDAPEDGLYTFTVEVEKGTASDETAELELVIKGTPFQSGPILDVDLKAAPYDTITATTRLIANSTAAWVKHADTGWYYQGDNANIGSGGFLDVVQSSAPNAPAADKMLRFSSTSNVGRGIGIDLSRPIAKGTGTYGVSFTYNRSTGNDPASKTILTFSDGAINEAGDNKGVEHASMNYTSNTDNSITALDDALILKYGYQTWVTVHAIIDTNATDPDKAILWYAEDYNDALSFEAFAKKADTLGVEGGITWGANEKIKSIRFNNVGGWTGSTVFDLAGLKVFEYTPPLSVYLDVDFDDDDIYEDGDVIVDGGAVPMTRHASGWYNSSANASPNFAASDYAKIVTDGGKQVLEIKNSSSEKQVNIDLAAPIEKNTGVYGLVFEYKLPAGTFPNDAYFGFGFSDTKFGTQGAVGANTGSNQARIYNEGFSNGNGSQLNRVVRGVDRDRTGSRGSALPMDTWYRVFAVIDTNESPVDVGWYVADMDEVITFEEIYENELAYNANGNSSNIQTINSLAFGGGSNTGTIRLANIQVFKHFEDDDDSEPEDEIFTHITLTPGADETKMNFSWWTQAGEFSASKVQIAKWADLENGDMPGDTDKFTIFTGDPPDTAAFGYDSNKVTATGLDLDTEYAYRLGDGAEWGSIRKFKTYDPANKYNVITVADPQIGTASEWRSALRTAVANADAMGGASFMISAGDHTNRQNSLSEMEGYLSPPVLKSLPVMTAVGNHDSTDEESSITAGDLVALLPLVYNWPNHNDFGANPYLPQGDPLATLRGGGDWWFRYGDALYISFNSNYNVDAAFTAREQWLTDIMAANLDAVWRIATFHHDLYGVDGHASTMGVGTPSRQVRWTNMLETFGFDVVFNGHDHVYGRSRFISGAAQGPANDTIRTYEDYQYPSVLDVTEKALYGANPPGAYVLPKGIQFIALGSPSDQKYAPREMEWAAYITGTLGAIPGMGEYGIMTIEGDSLTFSQYNVGSDTPLDSITIKKKADLNDLQDLLVGCEALQQGDASDASWAAFETAIANANAATPGNAHDLYMALYEAYYDIEPETDKAELGDLIDTVAGKLATATEGQWEGQFEPGSKALVQAMLDAAIIVYELRLSTQLAIDDAYDDLLEIYEWFLTTEGDVPCPWTELHEIGAAGVNTVDLIGWMSPNSLNLTIDDDDYRIFNWVVNPANIEMYDTMLNKMAYANSASGSGGQRTDPRHGPANKEGGRGDSNGHITSTAIGNWIRYELDVAQAGMYEVKLGAVNKQTAAQTIVLRSVEVDGSNKPLARQRNQQILATFEIAAGYGGTSADFEDPGTLPATVAADNQVYLPQGKVVIELYFMNDRVSRGMTAYTAGADVDILTFERKGDGSAPVVTPEPNRHYLPVMPFGIGNNDNGQRGWMVSRGDMTAGQFEEATRLVLELASTGAPAYAQTVWYQPNGGADWNATQEALSSATAAMVNGKYIIDLTKLVGYEMEIPYTGLGTLGFGPNSGSSATWRDINVMRAWLEFEGDFEEPAVPCPCGCGCDDPCPCGCANDGGTEEIWALEITQSLATDLNSTDASVGGVVRAGTPTFAFGGGGLTVSNRGADWASLDVDLRDLTLEAGATYRMTVEGTSATAFVLEFPLDDSPWQTGTVTGTTTGAVIEFDSVMPSVGGVSQITNGHRIRVRTVGTGNYTISSILIEEVLPGGNGCSCDDDSDPGPTPGPGPGPGTGGGGTGATDPDPDPDPEDDVVIVAPDEKAVEEIVKEIETIKEDLAGAKDEIADLFEDGAIDLGDTGSVTIGVGGAGTITITESGADSADEPAATVVIDVPIALTAEALEIDAKEVEEKQAVSFTVPDSILEEIKETLAMVADLIEMIQDAVDGDVDVVNNVTLPIDLLLAELTLDYEAIVHIMGGETEDIVFDVHIADNETLGVFAALVGDNPVYDFSILVNGKAVHDFGDGTVKVSIPYTLKEGEDPNAVLIYFLNESGNLEITRGYYDEESKRVLFSTTHFSKFVIKSEPAPAFADDTEIKDSWNGTLTKHVTFVASRGLYKGNERLDGNRYFSPADNMTYAQFIAVLGNYDGQKFAKFPDDQLAWAEKLGLFGKLDVDPEDSITRADMALILYNYIKAAGVKITGTRTAKFTDVGGLAAEYRTAINALYAAEIINGKDAAHTTYDPDATSTRAEVAAIIAQFVKAFGK